MCLFSVVVFPSFSSLTRFINYPVQRREGFSQNQNLRSLNLFFVSFFPSHDSLVFVSYETRIIIIILRDPDLVEKMWCVLQQRRERALFSCVFLYPPFQQKRNHKTRRGETRLNPSIDTHPSSSSLFTRTLKKKKTYHHHHHGGGIIIIDDAHNEFDGRPRGGARRRRVPTTNVDSTTNVDDDGSSLLLGGGQRR